MGLRECTSARHACLLARRAICWCIPSLMTQRLQSLIVCGKRSCHSIPGKLWCVAFRSPRLTSVALGSERVPCLLCIFRCLFFSSAPRAIWRRTVLCLLRSAPPRPRAGLRLHLSAPYVSALPAKITFSIKQCCCQDVVVHSKVLAGTLFRIRIVSLIRGFSVSHVGGVAPGCADLLSML